MLLRIGALSIVSAFALVACSSFSGVSAEVPADDDADSTDDGVSEAAPDHGDPESDSSLADSVADASVDGGVGCQSAPDCERVVFVTSTVIAGDLLNGIGGADAFCQQAAASPMAHSRVQGRVFSAWVSTGGQPANMRFVHGTQGYVLPNQTVVAANWAQWISDIHAAPLDVDETNTPLQGNADPRVWTGTKDTGEISGANCGAWTVPSGMGDYGMATTAMGWSYQGNLVCSERLHVYCVER